MRLSERLRTYRKSRKKTRPLFKITGIALLLLLYAMTYLVFDFLYGAGNKREIRSFNSAEVSQICDVYNIGLPDGAEIGYFQYDSSGNRKYYVLCVEGLSDADSFIAQYRRNNPAVKTIVGEEMLYVERKPVFPKNLTQLMQILTFTYHKYLGENHGVYLFYDHSSVCISVDYPVGGGIEGVGSWDIADRYIAVYYDPVEKLFAQLYRG